MPTLRINTVQTISVRDWNQFVEEVYGRPYNFQQQDGCRNRGTYELTVSEPTEDDESYDFENDTVPEVVNGPEMGVSFKAWLARDPKQPLSGREDSWALELWWSRNFYPSIEMVAADLHKKGLLAPGEYTIIIDW
jgi:hypothetical protein